MLLVCVSFMLRLTCHSLPAMLIIAAIVALVPAGTCGWAIEQSKTYLQDCLGRPELMLDLSVILTIDVSLQLAFCIYAAGSGQPVRWYDRAIRAFLIWFPGLLIFPVAFSILVLSIFSMPGADFHTVAWICSAGLFLFFTLGAKILSAALPERELRLEFDFLINSLIAMLGIIATVNGRTAVAGNSEIDIAPLAGVLLLLATEALAGYILYNKKILKS